jgi:ABC-type phosphate transport system substrate-binding protein
MRPASVLQASSLAVLLSAAAFVGADVRSYVVVVNGANPTNAVAPADLARVFRKTVRQWTNGLTIAPVDQSFQSPVRLRFSQDVLGRSPGQMQEYWLRETYSGREVPPPVRDSDAAVLEFVRANAGAIGYVSPSVSLPPGVKALAVSQ